MRLHRFFIKTPITEQKIVIDDEDLLHQWRNVFRYNTGTELLVFNGDGKEYRTVIERIANREVVLEIVEEREGIDCSSGPILYQALIKKDNMEWIVQKATELGVSKIVPILSERSEKKGFNLERARKIAVEASEQCGRADVPVIEDSQELLDVGFDKNILTVAFDRSGLPIDGKLVSKDYNLTTIFIGPEGGWSEREIEKFKEAKVEIFSLGELTLRAETAAVVALSKFL